MPLCAGFAEADITPPLGTHKIGWLIDIIGDQVADPLFARAAVFANGSQTIVFVQLDTLSVRWTLVNDIRRRVEQQFGIPGAGIMVSATHSHAGPAVANLGRVTRDEGYIETLTCKCVEMVGKAFATRRPVEWGFGHTVNFLVAHNRRVVMRDGSARTHGNFGDPEALYPEGPIDPELAVLAARDLDGNLLGCLVNYSCHPTHHGGDTVFSAGYPGVLAREMRAAGCPCTLYLNGAAGNLHTGDPIIMRDMGMEDAGTALAADVQRVLAEMSFNREATLDARASTIQLPYRKVTEDEVGGYVHAAQRFVDPQSYIDGMPALLARIEQRGTQPVEAQVLTIDNYAFAGIPAEYFVEHGLRIKTESYPRHALIVAQANGMIGYLPTQAAHTRGGYETTFAGSSRMAPEAGDLLADAVIAVIKQTTMATP